MKSNVKALHNGKEVEGIQILTINGETRIVTNESTFENIITNPVDKKSICYFLNIYDINGRPVYENTYVKYLNKDLRYVDGKQIWEYNVCYSETGIKGDENFTNSFMYDYGMGYVSNIEIIEEFYELK